MPRKVKTIQVEALKVKANKIFKTSENDYEAGRRHIQTFVEDILMATGNYKGFNYLLKNEVGEGKTFGIEYTTDNGPIFHDQTRIEFF